MRGSSGRLHQSYILEESFSTNPTYQRMVMSSKHGCCAIIPREDGYIRFETLALLCS